MQKVGFPSLKSLDQLKSLSGSAMGASKTLSFSSRPAADSNSCGSFANLKIAAERLVKEQASVKTDLEMANTKLKKSMEHIRALEEKLQNAFNENSKLKVKQKEDEKLWKGLESKFSSTKTLCDQLNETLQLLASQVQDTEKDKEFFEGKLSSTSITLDGLSQQLNNLALKMESAEETIANREIELGELKLEKEKQETFYRDEQSRNAKLIESKESLIKEFEKSVAASKLLTDSLNSELKQACFGLKSKEDEIERLLTTQEHLKKEKSDIQMHNDEIEKKLNLSLVETKNLETLVQVLAEHLVELDSQSLTFLDKFDQLNSLHVYCFKLTEQERNLADKHAQNQYNQLNDKILCLLSEIEALQLVNRELDNNLAELQKVQESLIAQLSEQCRSSKEHIMKLESEVKFLDSKKTETEMLVVKLEEKINALSDISRHDEFKVQDLQLKVLELESENEHNKEKFQIEMQKKVEQIDTLQNENEKHKKIEDSLKNEACQLHKILEEKEKLLLQHKEQEKKLEEQKRECHDLLNSAESRLSEAKRQYDMMLESKQSELSKHLKEISQRNDQAINDIRSKYEMEKMEIVNREKEKADKAIEEMERNCGQKLAECKEESRQHLIHIQEEHAALVSYIRQEYDSKELSLKAVQSEELKRTKMEAEIEIREKTMMLRSEHEAQVKALSCQHEDEYSKLEEELNLQKSKEDRQRALLQLQWKVMGDKTHDEQEVNSKDYSVSSIKYKGSDGSRRSQHIRATQEKEKKDSPFLHTTQTPVSQLLKTVKKVNKENAIGIPKHHKKVTHHEYEVETSDGRTITKRRKTRSTVLFEDPRKQKKTPQARTPRVVGEKVRPQHPSNIGDLFTEGSLNPYTEDPYAFD